MYFNIAIYQLWPIRSYRMAKLLLISSLPVKQHKSQFKPCIDRTKRRIKSEELPTVSLRVIENTILSTQYPN